MDVLLILTFGILFPGSIGIVLNSNHRVDRVDRIHEIGCLHGTVEPLVGLIDAVLELLVRELFVGNGNWTDYGFAFSVDFVILLSFIITILTSVVFVDDILLSLRNKVILSHIEFFVFVMVYFYNGVVNRRF